MLAFYLFMKSNVYKNKGWKDTILTILIKKECLYFGLYLVYC